jgi:DNA topoisomerase-3
MILCEKHSVAASVAAVLGADKKRSGYLEGGGYIVSYCFGHLLELAAPDAYGEQYAKWRYADLPIVPRVWKHAPAKDKAAQLKILKELMNKRRRGLRRKRLRRGTRGRAYLSFGV